MHTQTYQVSRISRETPAFWSHLPLTRCITNISRISSTKFIELILSRIVKIVATRCQYFILISAQTPLGELTFSTSPDLQLDLRSPTSKVREDSSWEGD